MHPILKNRDTMIMYLVAWLVLGLLLAALLAIPGRASWLGAIAFSLPMMVIYAFMALSAWYVCRAFPLQRTNTAKLIIVLLCASILSCAAWLLICYGWAVILEGVQPPLAPSDRYRESVPLMASTGIVLFLLAAAVNYLIAEFELSRSAERNVLESQISAREAELKALRAQIDPHFLFNSLNSISALTVADPIGARAMALKLADFLRLSMNYGGLKNIALDQEISLLARFLEIEQVRFGSRLQVNFAISADAQGCSVPPLLLQPLIENAVGHGIAHLLEGGTIDILAKKSGEQIRIIIENPVDPSRPRNSTNGYGLENVRQRVQRMYGSEGRVEALEKDHLFTVVIDLPVKH